MLRRTILLMFLATAVSYGQYSLPAGKVFPNPPIQSCSDGQQAYFFDYYHPAVAGGSFMHYGNSWGWSQVLATPFMAGRSQNMAQLVHNGDIYVVRAFQRTFNDWFSVLFQYRNNTWFELDTLQGFVFDMVVLNNDLVLGGAFRDSTRQLEKLVAYRNGSFQQMGTWSSQDTIHDLEVLQNKLFASGRIGAVENTDTAQIIRWDSINGNPVFPFHFTNNSGGSVSGQMFHLGSTLYVMGQGNKLYEAISDSLINRGNIPFQQGNNVHPYDREVSYVNGVAYWSLGNRIAAFSGQQITSIDPRLNDHPITTITAAKGELYGGYAGPWALNGVIYGHAFRWSPNNAAGWGVFGGYSFIDNNNNCQIDNSELADVSFSIEIEERNTGAKFTGLSTDSFYLALPYGDYQIDTVRIIDPLYQHLHLDRTCLTDTFSLRARKPNSSINLPFVHNGPMDLAVDINFYSSRLRQGFVENLRLRAYNPGTSNVSQPFQVQLVLPSTVTFQSSQPSPNTIQGDTLSFNLSGLNLLSSKNINLQVEIDTANPIGDTLCFTTELSGVQEPNLLNNFDTLCLPVRAAYDPNDKRPNLEQSLPGLAHLDYHIRFQNTGTDTAYRVVVVDTLEPYFRPATIQLGNTSHPAHFRMEGENVLIWTFNDILLPDSTTNLSESSGFLTFSIDVDPSLGISSVIDNDAEIYFDFQPPVHTNHAQTFIVSQLSLADLEPNDLIAYPNPVQDFLTLEETEGLESAVLLDLFGRKVKEWNFDQKAKRQNLDFSELAPGTYLLRIGLKSVKLIKSH